jgi:cyclopropane-fatty-acyl-phospholipid synthase
LRDEVPAAFFATFLGPRMKYSCGLWDSATALPEADEAMLAQICERAGVENGMKILDVGAGWGPLTFWLADHYPRSFVTALVNSLEQGRFIMNRAADRHWGCVISNGDAREVEPIPMYDRVLAIEMIEHTGNPEAMLARLKGWLKPGGRVFIQSIAHAERSAKLTLPWFGPGVMLSDPLLDSFDAGLTTIGRWTVDGTHYRRTIEAWRARLEAGRATAAAALGSSRRYLRWRAFLMTCEEMFGWDEGRAWRVVQRLYEA